MISGNSSLNVPTFPKASQLLGQDTWQAFKDQVELNVEVRGLKGYLNGSIPKPTSATYIYTAQTSSLPDIEYLIWNKIFHSPSWEAGIFGRVFHMTDTDFNQKSVDMLKKME
ncbi:hypothetical protein BT96DRAFT_942942 [Gymnopus androsaceus JB14]|uniref:Uncharacterized protein n=1 Tax=Gymnopus androsaceus JB14 TaxID=1447944 RepID=A0A6A4HBW7_9AGAR|nr:hypothetical protein BT96DRAFT_942942 [Gymnopus androsaceus JB14]